jgi:hypothetical protein
MTWWKVLCSDGGSGDHCLDSYLETYWQDSLIFFRDTICFSLPPYYESLLKFRSNSENPTASSRCWWECPSFVIWTQGSNTTARSWWKGFHFGLRRPGYSYQVLCLAPSDFPEANLIQFRCTIRALTPPYMYWRPLRVAFQNLTNYFVHQPRCFNYSATISSLICSSFRPACCHSPSNFAISEDTQQFWQISDFSLLTSLSSITSG